MDFFIEQFCLFGKLIYNRVVATQSSLTGLFETHPDRILSNPLFERLFKGFFNIQPPL